MEADRNRSEATDGYFVQLPLSVLFHPRLSDGAKVMYATLQSYDWAHEQGQRKGYVFPSNPTLADKRTKSTETVRRDLKCLKEEGLIKIERDGKRRVIRFLPIGARDGRQP